MSKVINCFISVFLFVILQACNSDKVSNHITKADEARKNKQFELSIQEYEEAIKVNPQNADIYFGLGQTYEDSGDLKQALKAYLKALEINPKYVNANLLTANAYRRLGEMKAAIHYAEIGATLSPGEGWIRHVLGLTYEEAGDLDLAEKSFEKAVELVQSEVEFILDLARMYEKRGKKEQALTQYRNALIQFQGFDEIALKRHEEEIKTARAGILRLEQNK
jgi:tetratricopeptide (TPR) repeat protein